ncbi:NAD(P)/FAD-dependent oxidoreductase, partial [Patulibacter sp. S7RM1-6]
MTTASPVSHWFARLDPAGMPAPRPRLDGDRRVDVCIVGGGYTGLWTAYELRRSHPHLEVLVVEREVCGFGASGRNGGWVQGELAGSTESWERRGGPGAAVRMHHAIRDTLGEIRAAVEREGIACDWHEGGTLTVAQTPLEWERLRAVAADARAQGIWEDGGDALLGAAALRE